MRQPDIYIMRDQIRDRVAAIMQEGDKRVEAPAMGLWSPALLFACLLLVSLLLAGMSA